VDNFPCDVRLSLELLQLNLVRWRVDIEYFWNYGVKPWTLEDYTNAVEDHTAAVEGCTVLSCDVRLPMEVIQLNLDQLMVHTLQANTGAVEG